jgi:hypothetical protein
LPIDPEEAVEANDGDTGTTSEVVEVCDHEDVAEAPPLRVVADGELEEDDDATIGSDDDRTPHARQSQFGSELGALHSVAEEVAEAVAREVLEEDDEEDENAIYFFEGGSDIRERDRDVESDADIASEDERTISKPTPSSDLVDLSRNAINTEDAPLLADETTALVVAAAGEKKGKSKKRNADPPPLRVPFYRVPFASSKSLVMTWTTLAVCVACTGCALMVAYATRSTVVTVGPDGRALAVPEPSTSVETRRTTPTPPRRGSHDDVASTESGSNASRDAGTDAPRVARDARDGDEDADDAEVGWMKDSEVSVSSRASDSMSAASSKHSKHSGQSRDVSSLTTRNRSRKRASSLGDTSAVQLPETCASRRSESRYGVHRQIEPLCRDAAADAVGCVGSIDLMCQKCYLKGTPAETQKRSMGWCRREVCEEHGVAGCAPGEEEASSAELGSDRSEGRVSRFGEAARDGLEEDTTGRHARARSTRRLGPASKSALLMETTPRSGNTVERARGVDWSDEDFQNLSVFETRKRSGESVSATPNRMVGRCSSDPGDVQLGRFVWEDGSCLRGGAGCAKVRKHHCRFCVARISDLFGDDSEGTFGRCPKDVCAVHNLLWELCDDT